METLFGRSLTPAGRGLEVRAMNQAAGPAEVLIYDVIGKYYDWEAGELRGVEARDILEAIAGLDGRDLVVRINSPGGVVSDGVAIYNALRRRQGSVDVAIDGQAGSIASVIAMAGRTVSMAENATMMIHKAAALTFGNSDDLRRIAHALDKIDESLVLTYARKTGQDEDQILAWMREETWMSSRDALARKFVDQIVDGRDVVALGKLDPGALQAPSPEALDKVRVEGVDPEARRGQRALRAAKMRVLMAEIGS